MDSSYCKRLIQQGAFRYDIREVSRTLIEGHRFGNYKTIEDGDAGSPFGLDNRPGQCRAITEPVLDWPIEDDAMSCNLSECTDIGRKMCRADIVRDIYGRLPPRNPEAAGVIRRIVGSHPLVLRHARRRIAAH
jgi:hypothetical protein